MLTKLIHKLGFMVGISGGKRSFSSVCLVADGTKTQRCSTKGTGVGDGSLSALCLFVGDGSLSVLCLFVDRVDSQELKILGSLSCCRLVTLFSLPYCGRMCFTQIGSESSDCTWLALAVFSLLC